MKFENKPEVFTNNVKNNIKLELYYLIRQYCKSYKIAEFRYDLFLHDFTKIKYIIMQIETIERFISIVTKYWDYFLYLVSNLHFEEDIVNIESSDKVIGNIDVTRTNKLFLYGQDKKVIACNINKKNVFISENILLASTILEIKLLSKKILVDGINDQITGFKTEHKFYLERIHDYSQFLLKDRFLKKLIDHYLSNYENFERIIMDIDYRLIKGKVKNKYFNLIQFFKIWKQFKWVVNSPHRSLFDILIPYLDSIDEDKLYEMWIFYSIISLFEPVIQKRPNLFTNNESKFSIEYHQKRTLGWKIERRGIISDIRRFPDIVVKKNGQDIAIIDAKCMEYNENIQSEDSPEMGPDRNIVNQMILYLDYHKKCDLGFVLYADTKKREDVLIKSDTQKIYFLNCFPYEDTAFTAFRKIKQALCVISKP